MKNHQNAKLGRKQKPFAVHARQPANRLNAMDSSQLPSVATIHAARLDAVGGLLTLAKGGKESQKEPRLL
jgi:hypothetical protein